MSKFKPINRPELEANYWINEAGDIIDNNNSLIPQFTTGPYPLVCLSYWKGKTWKRKNYYVHRLVAITWQPIANPENHQVHHKDEDKSNPHNDNLQWLTPEEHRRLHQGISKLNMELFKLCVEKYGEKRMQNVLLKLIERS